MRQAGGGNVAVKKAQHCDPNTTPITAWIWFDFNQAASGSAQISLILVSFHQRDIPSEGNQALLADRFG
jgi:hypothetical protein